MFVNSQRNIYKFNIYINLIKIPTTIFKEKDHSTHCDSPMNKYQLYYALIQLLYQSLHVYKKISAKACYFDIYSYLLDKL